MAAVRPKLETGLKYDQKEFYKQDALKISRSKSNDSLNLLSISIPSATAFSLIFFRADIKE